MKQKQLKENALLDGKYQIIKAVNQGGMGIIYKAIDMRLMRKVAIKQMIRVMEQKTETEIQRMENSDLNEKNRRKDILLLEANIQKELDSPMFSKVLDYFETEEYVYLVIEWIEGLNLKEYIEKNGVPDERLANQWALDITVMLTRLHARRPTIIFQDLKPENIMVQVDGQLKLIDFGAAIQLFYSGERIQHIGTRGYAAPEQIKGERLTVESDIYTFGTTLYSILTGIWLDKPPYKITTYIGEKGALSNFYRQIIEKATNEDPKERYHSMDEIGSILEEMLLEKKYENTRIHKNQDGKMTKLLFDKEIHPRMDKQAIRRIKTIFVSEKREAGLW